LSFIAGILDSLVVSLGEAVGILCDAFSDALVQQVIV